jgi:hypothetical protein
MDGEPRGCAERVEGGRRSKLDGSPSNIKGELTEGGNMIRRMNGGLLATLLLLLGTVSGSALTLNRDGSGGTGDNDNNVAGTEIVEQAEIRQAPNVKPQDEQTLTNKEESSLLLNEKTAVCLNSEVVKRNTGHKSLSPDPNVTEGYLVTLVKSSPNLARSGPEGKLTTDQKITSG